MYTLHMHVHMSRSQAQGTVHIACGFWFGVCTTVTAIQLSLKRFQDQFFVGCGNFARDPQLLMNPDVADPPACVRASCVCIAAPQRVWSAVAVRESCGTAPDADLGRAVEVPRYLCEWTCSDLRERARRAGLGLQASQA